MAAVAAAQNALTKLAEIPGPAGAERAVAAAISERLPVETVTDNTGSLTVSFGSGGPHTLIVAGMDEPGFVVSGVTEDGYLRLQSLAQPAPSRGFESYFLGQPVTVISRGDAPPLPGVIAAPSVHLKDDRRGSGSTELFVDIGAASDVIVAAAGVGVLDRVRLDEPVTRFAADTLAGPWISSRAGAALLLALAQRLHAEAPPHQVTLAFVTQQYFHNAGLMRVIERTAPDRILVLRPGGGDQPEVAPLEGWSSELRDELLAWAGSNDVGVGRGGDPQLSFGPFNRVDFLPDKQQSAVLTLGPENPGTPVEVLRLDELRSALAVVAHLAGVTAPALGEIAAPEDRPTPLGNPIQQRLRALLAVMGVSGDEGDVREEVVRQLPDWAVSETDRRGNLIVKLGPDRPPESLFIAHMDEVGFRVTRAADDGALTLEAQGGVSAELFAWHLLEPPSLGLRNATAWAPPGTIGVGASLAPRNKAPRYLLDQRVNARGLDDRAGCLVLIEALHRLSPDTIVTPTWFVFSVEEETGLLGAADIAERVAPRRVFAIDSLVTSDTPLEARRIAYIKLGDGPAVRAQDQSGLTPLAAVQEIEWIARDAGIPLQVGVTAGGNDGSKFTPAGSINIPLAFPLRYSHTSAETADLRDIRALIDLVTAIVSPAQADIR